MILDILGDIGHAIDLIVLPFKFLWDMFTTISTAIAGLFIIIGSLSTIFISFLSILPSPLLFSFISYLSVYLGVIVFKLVKGVI